METNDFFQSEAQRCREGTARATVKVDRGVAEERKRTGVQRAFSSEVCG
jgi:hypothetical protein